jgi:4-aminobutyrate aminotransferase-like enzyme
MDNVFVWRNEIHSVFFIALVDGKMQYLFDEKGRRYLDMFAGIVTVSVGHCHPEVNKAAKEQMVQHLTPPPSSFFILSSKY